MPPSSTSRFACALCALPLVASSPAHGQSPTSAAPPAPLACLARYYAVTAVSDDTGWFARLPDGTRVPWDDKVPKSFEQRLDKPDAQDVFSIPYRAGAIVPVTTPDDDPGRIRVDAIFQSTYPTTDADMTRIDFLGQKLRVHKKVAPAFLRVAERLSKARTANPALAPFLTHLGGTFVKRNIAGTTRASAHSYGVSMDINAERSEYWRWQRPASPIKWANHIPQAIVDAFEAEGFIWGGRWYHYDTMHFEYRPELLDPACR